MSQTIENGDVGDFASKSRTEGSDEVQFVDAAPPQVTSATVTQVTAGVASGTVVSASTTRRFVSVLNTDTSQTAYLNIGAAATTAKIPLRPGEWWHSKSHGVTFTEEVTCIRGASDDITLVVVHG